MKLRVLGCYGGSASGMHPTCFLLDDRVAIDAGALTSGLSVPEQARVDHVFLSHAHLDHFATLPYLLDNVFCQRDEPVRLHGCPHALENMRAHVFNDVIWPDFSKLNNGRTDLLEYVPFPLGSRVQVGEVAITTVAMDHTVPCAGYLLQGPETSVALCGDTQGVDTLVQALPQARGLAAIILEVSFPDAELEVARVSAHLTPASFARALEQLPADVPVYVTHIKPTFVDVVRAELEALGDARIRFLEQGREYTF